MPAYRCHIVCSHKPPILEMNKEPLTVRYCTRNAASPTRHFGTEVINAILYRLGVHQQTAFKY
jgi:hypothetical protein